MHTLRIPSARPLQTAPRSAGPPSPASALALALVFSLCLAPALAAPTNLPAASTQTVVTDTNGVIQAPSNFFSANSIVRTTDITTNTIWVALNGSDSNSGLEPHVPKLSLTNALAEVATSGVWRINIAPGTYDDEHITSSADELHIVGPGATFSAYHAAGGLFEFTSGAIHLYDLTVFNALDSAGAFGLYVNGATVYLHGGYYYSVYAANGICVGSGFCYISPSTRYNGQTGGLAFPYYTQTDAIGASADTVRWYSGDGVTPGYSNLFDLFYTEEESRNLFTNWHNNIYVSTQGSDDANGHSWRDSVLSLTNGFARLTADSALNLAPGLYDDLYGLTVDLGGHTNAIAGPGAHTMGFMDSFGLRFTNGIIHWYDVRSEYDNQSNPFGGIELLGDAVLYLHSGRISDLRLRNSSVAYVSPAADYDSITTYDTAAWLPMPQTTNVLLKVWPNLDLDSTDDSTVTQLSDLLDVAHTNDAAQGRVLAYQADGLIAPTNAGAGDFLADGSVPMTGPLDIGGNGLSNFTDAVGSGHVLVPNISVNSTSSTHRLLVSGGDRDTGLVVESTANAGVRLLSSGQAGRDWQMFASFGAGSMSGGLTFFDDTADQYVLAVTPGGGLALGSTYAHATDGTDMTNGNMIIQGSLGVGTNDPQTALHIAGDSTLEGDVTIGGSLTVSNEPVIRAWQHNDPTNGSPKCYIQAGDAIESCVLTNLTYATLVGTNVGDLLESHPGALMGGDCYTCAVGVVSTPAFANLDSFLDADIAAGALLYWRITTNEDAEVFCGSAYTVTTE